MTPIQRRVAAVSAPILLALSLTACGGAPTDASEKDFCEAYNSSEDIPDDASTGEQVDSIKDTGEQLEETGTPEGISDEELEGFEIFVDKITSIDEDGLEEVLKAEDEEAVNDALGVSSDDAAKVQAFTEYADETCA